jgi:type III restriction enzyme
MNSGGIYITETMDGKTYSDQDKNIIPYAQTKHEALKNYVKQHRVKWASIRDYDEKLWYLNDGEWIYRIGNEKWGAVGNLLD